MSAARRACGRRVATARVAFGAALLVALVAACGGSSATPAPAGSAAAGSSPLAAVTCPAPAAVQAALSSAFPATDTLTLATGQGSGRTADQTYCTYRAPNGDDVPMVIIVGDNAGTMFSQATDINTTNPTVGAAAFPVGEDRWLANSPILLNPEAPAIVAGGQISNDVYAYVQYRYLTFPTPSGRPAPTIDETWAVLALALK